MMDARRVRIAYVVSQFPETYETFITREVKALEEAGFEIGIFSLKPCRDEVIHDFAKGFIARTHYAGRLFSARTVGGIARFKLGHPGRWARASLGLIGKTARRPGVLAKSMYAYLAAAPFARAMIDERVGHIHAHWASVPSSVAAALSALTGIPYSLTAHAYDIYAPNPALAGNIRGARFVVTCTGYNERFLGERFPDTAGKIVRVYHGVEPASYEMRRHERSEMVEILSVGRLVETKGYEYLLRAMGELAKRGLRFRLRVVGNGPLAARLKGMARELGLEKQVEFIGAMAHEELMGLYRSADIFALASVVAKNGDRDGIPNVILEAMASGLPVAATRVSGIPEAVIEGETGFLAPEREAGALADAIEKLARDAELRGQLGRAARRLVEERFDIEVNCRALGEVFKNRIEE